MFEWMGRSDCHIALIAHLVGEALNVALLVPEAQRILQGVLLKTLSAHYSSPGRFAKYKRQFERMTRPPGDDPAAFAIELETLARKAFVDVDASVRLQLVRDRFIIGQENRALRRHLDSVGPDTPISDIVDRCRVWESHDESNSRPIARHKPTGPRGVFQVTQQASEEHSEMSTEPAAFAIELETLARKTFVDVDASVRLQLVRDRFIIGQENRALRRHLDSVGPDTPISDIVDRCRVWESHDESNSRPIARHEPTGPRGVFQVTQQASEEHSKMSTEPDPAPSEYEVFAQHLRDLAQQPGNSETIDIEQLLKQLLPVDTVVEETGQPTSENQEVDDRASGNVV